MAAIHEYILVYAREASKCPSLMKEKPSAQLMISKAMELKKSGLGYFEAQKLYKKWVNEKVTAGIIGSGESPYKNLHPETFRPFRGTPSCAQDKPESRYHGTLKHPVTGKPCGIPSKGWKWKKATLLEMAKYNDFIEGDNFVLAGRMVYGKDERKIPDKLQYLDEKTDQVLPSVISSSYGGDKDLPEGIVFSTPKPVALIKQLIRAVPKQGGVVLDYFAGSGTTAQAVHELNLEDGGERSWIMIEEIGSTFHEVMLPRIDYFDPKRNYSTFELKQVNVGDKSLLKMFNEYSFDFLSAYHQVSDEASAMIEGLNIIGFEKRSEKIVAMTIPTLRKSPEAFIEELATFKDAIKRTRAKSAVIYTIKNDNYEEPWLGLDKSLLSGTTCKSFDVVEIPEQLIQEWNEVLNHMAA